MKVTFESEIITGSANEFAKIIELKKRKRERECVERELIEKRFKRLANAV